MLGRPLGATFPAKATAPWTPRALSVRHVTAPGVLDVCFEVRQGEIVGIAGLVGAGRTELARAIFGATAAQTAGRACGRASRRLCPRASLSNGLAMIPESRKDEGLLFGRSVVENVSLSSLNEFSRAGIVDRKAERAAAVRILERVELKGGSPAAPVARSRGATSRRCCSRGRPPSRRRRRSHTRRDDGHRHDDHEHRRHGAAAAVRAARILGARVQALGQGRW